MTPSYTPPLPELDSLVSLLFRKTRHIQLMVLAVLQTVAPSVTQLARHTMAAAALSMDGVEILQIIAVLVVYLAVRLHQQA